jgi:endoglucanase
MRAGRRSFIAVGSAVAIAATLIAGAGLAVVAAGPAAADPALSVAVDGNHFVDGAGNAIRLLGVDVPGTEYACEEGWAYSSVPITAASADAIAGWDADAVRVPLNEDCWLGINGQPTYDHAAGGAGYQAAVEDWVADLNAAGLYVILDLHWSAPGTDVADGQRPMPDTHSVAFWSSVAATFETNDAVVFDAFNEPYSPKTDFPSTPSVPAVTWTCWEHGHCAVPVTRDGTAPNGAPTYQAVGMQTLVTAIRSTGAGQPIMLGGLDYANDLTGWLAHEPVDPDGALVASFHNYDHGGAPGACDTVTCWNAVVAPVAADVPVVTGELDEGYDCVDPPSPTTGPTSFDATYMRWADAHGVSYVAWGWYVLTTAGRTTAATDCSLLEDGGSDAYSLVTSTAGTPVAPDGTTLRAHLVALASGGGTTPPATSPPATNPTLPRPPPGVPSPPGTTVPSPSATPPTTSGYDLVGVDGGVFVLPPGGSGGFYGSLPGLGVDVDDIVGIVPSSDGRGYFLVGADGGVFSFGDTTYEGSLPGLGVDVDDIVGIVPSSDDRGYLLVGRDGGVFAFGDAPFLGSLPAAGVPVDDVVGIAAAADDTGYWVVQADGTVTGFGSAEDYGNASAGAGSITGIAGTPAGTGYWVVTANGGVDAYGMAAYFGSLPALGVTPTKPVVSVVPSSDGGGYWLVGADGGIFSFGDATNLGSLPGLGVDVDDVVGAVPTS